MFLYIAVVTFVIIVIIAMIYSQIKSNYPQSYSATPSATGISALVKLNDKEIAIYTSEISESRLNPGIAYLLWAFTGWAGGHKLYQENFWGLCYPVLSIWGINSFFSSLPETVFSTFSQGYMELGSRNTPGFFAFYLWAALMLVDLITLPTQIKLYNQNSQERILEQLKNARQTDELVSRLSKG